MTSRRSRITDVGRPNGVGCKSMCRQRVSKGSRIIVVEENGGRNVAKYRGPVCRLCRREGEKLFLKGSRCMTEKCAIERRSYPPGQHGQAQASAFQTTACSYGRSRSCGVSTAFKNGSSAASLSGRNADRSHWRCVAALARMPFGQCRLPARIRGFAQGSAAVGESWPYDGQWPEDQRPGRTSESRRCGGSARTQP